MKTQIHSANVFFMCLLLLFSYGCQEKKKEERHIQPLAKPAQNAASSSPEKQVGIIEEHTPLPEEKNTTQAEAVQAEDTPTENDLFFSLSDQNGTQYHISPDHNRLLLKDDMHPVVILNFFTPWSLPCKNQAFYLDQLQKKYHKEVLVIGILLHPDQYLDTLETFIQENHTSFFIASGSENDRLAKHLATLFRLPDMLPIPLTVIYHNGTAYRHYRGAVPVEMLEYDLKTLLEKGKK
jgi:thiol-disulfide isomerase/thioredoxin